jgi:hypothetical protein
MEAFELLVVGNIIARVSAGILTIEASFLSVCRRDEAAS